MSGEEPTADAEVRRLEADNIRAALRQAKGKVLGTVGISRDVHEFKTAREALRANEAKLREFACQLERSNRELQDFAYVASHDLQEPLRKIVVFGERLKEKAAPKTHQRQSGLAASPA